MSPLAVLGRTVVGQFSSNCDMLSTISDGHCEKSKTSHVNTRAASKMLTWKQLDVQNINFTLTEHYRLTFE